MQYTLTQEFMSPANVVHKLLTVVHVCIPTCSPYLQHGLCTLAHLMGASIRKDITSSVTHIVAYSVSGSKYKVLYTCTWLVC